MFSGMAVSVQFDAVVKRFGAVTAVDGVSLDVAPGELYFLLGPSGCGKTTLLRCLAGFYELDGGAIRLDGKDISSVPAYRRDTGMVFQSYALWPHMTVRENVAFGLRMRRTPAAELAERTDRALRVVRMESMAARRPNELSGGQQQRVALARALVVHPRCLLLDEPLSNLDAKLRLEMRGEIRRICKEAGLTAVYVTHDQKEALSIADRIAVLRDGRVEQTGIPEEIYRRPRSTFVAGFVGETNFLPGRVTAVSTGACRVSTAAGELTAALPGAGPTVGRAVTLSIRPESVRLTPPPADAPNRFRASVHDTVYQGELAQHQATLPGVAGAVPATLKVFELNPRLLARDHSAEATVWVDPDDVVLLEE